MKDFKQLNIFQKTRMFNKDIYLKTKKFPTEERFGITSQIRRASVSIATNTAVSRQLSVFSFVYSEKKAVS